MKLYQVDAFSNKVFGGNQAAICPLKEWLPESIMQKIAAENNLSETAFFVPEKEGFHIRWFTPITEVDLCGHATLASAHVLFNHEQYSKKEIIFYCRVGILRVSKTDKYIQMDFPASPLSLSKTPEALTSALGKTPLSYYVGGDFGMAILDSEEDIKSVSPNFIELQKVEEKVIVITAPGKEVDFVSRVFGPKVGINEDPVTGSAHTRLVPYWSERLNKKTFTAIQLSERRGHLFCEDKGDRILISGEAVTYLIGEFSI